MLLKEILTEVDLIAPNAVSADQKINFINQIQNELFRELHLKTNSFLFYTVKDTEIYALPDECQPENILEVYINGKDYQKKSVDQRGKGYMIVNGQLFIQPTPDNAYESFLYYYASPTQLSADNLDVSPDLRSDFHQLLTFGCAKKVAMIMKDYDTMKVLTDQYNDLYRFTIIQLSPKVTKVWKKRRWL